MTRRAKALGLVLLALAAIGAIGAQGASATVVEHQFLSASSPTVLKATDEPNTNHTFTVGGFATVECQTVHTLGTAMGTSNDTITLQPTYTACTFFDEEASVDSSLCAVILDSDTVDGHADMFVECVGTGIVIETAACTMVLGQQTTAPSITYTNIPNGDIPASWTTGGLRVHSWAGPLCFLLEDEGMIAGEYQGLAVIEGFTDSGGPATAISIGGT